MTNYERIKRFSIEEPSYFLYKILQGDGICESFSSDECSGECKQCLLGWLKTESEENYERT